VPTGTDPFLFQGEARASPILPSEQIKKAMILNGLWLFVIS